MIISPERDLWLREEGLVHGCLNWDLQLIFCLVTILHQALITKINDDAE